MNEHDRSGAPSGDGEEEPVVGVEALPPAATPPDGLEDAVVAALRREGLIGGPARAASSPGGAAGGVSWRWLAAACILAFATGGLVVRLVDRAPSSAVAPGDAAQAAAVYALLLYEDEGFAQGETGHRPEHVEEYRRWVGSLRTGGRLADGERLSYTGTTLRLGADGGVVELAGEAVRGPAGRLAGFFLIEAENDAEARRLAADCPHLRHGGTVELRRVER
jgi:hypothetical protein